MIDQDKINKIRELYTLGLSKTKIAKELNCSTPTVLKYVKDITLVDPMIGKTFGKLTVKSKAEKRENITNRCIYYICECECGNICEV